jgi:hypothetical protein
VKVASDDSIEYEGRIYKLSPFVGTFMPEEHRNNSGAYQGAKYFSYNGKVLDEIRKEKTSTFILYCGELFVTLRLKSKT